MDVVKNLRVLVLPTLYRLVRYVMAANAAALAVVYLTPGLLSAEHIAYREQFHLLPPGVYGAVFIITSLLLLINDREMLPISYSVSAAAWFGLAISFLFSGAWTAVITYFSLSILSVIYGRIEYRRRQ